MLFCTTQISHFTFNGCYIILLYHTATSYCHIILLYHTATSYCYIILLYHTAISYCYIILRYHTAISYCDIILLYHTAISYCYIILLYHTAISYCYIILLHLVQKCSILSVASQFIAVHKTSRRLFCLLIVPCLHLQPSWIIIGEQSIFRYNGCRKN
jgi:hypothetical protein